MRCRRIRTALSHLWRSPMKETAHVNSRLSVIPALSGLWEGDDPDRAHPNGCRKRAWPVSVSPMRASGNVGAWIAKPRPPSQWTGPTWGKLLGSQRRRQADALGPTLGPIVKAVCPMRGIITLFRAWRDLVDPFVELPLCGSGGRGSCTNQGGSKSLRASISCARSKASSRNLRRRNGRFVKPSGKSVLQS
jgi:hypothetical protein